MNEREEKLIREETFKIFGNPFLDNSFEYPKITINSATAIIREHIPIRILESIVKYLNISLPIASIAPLLPIKLNPTYMA